MTEIKAKKTAESVTGKTRSKRTSKLNTAQALGQPLNYICAGEQNNFQQKNK